MLRRPGSMTIQLRSFCKALREAGSVLYGNSSPNLNSLGLVIRCLPVPSAVASCEPKKKKKKMEIMKKQ
jgi:hypothetical protein